MLCTSWKKKSLIISIGTSDKKNKHRLNVDKIKIDLGQVGYEHVNCIDLADDILQTQVSKQLGNR